MALSYEDWFKQIYTPANTNESGFVDQFSPELMARQYSQYSQPDIWQGLTDEQYFDFNSPFWQNRYSPDTPWQKVVAENSSMNLLGPMADSGYLSRFQGYDETARSQVYDLLHNLSNADRDSRRTNDIWAASVPLAALGGYLGSTYGAGTGAATDTAATGATTGTSATPAVASAGPEFTGGFTGTVTGSPGLTGTAAGSPGLSVPTSGATGAGALSSGFFGAESLYPVLGGTAAATGATQLGSSSSGATAPGNGTAQTAAGTGTALSRILDGSATAADWLSIGGNVAGAGLGYLAADRQGERLDALAREYMAFGAPSRARYEASFDPNFNIAQQTGVQQAIDTSTEAMLRKLSAQGGNPYGSPGGLAEMQKYIVGNVALPQLNEYRRQNMGAGGLAALTAAAPGAAMGGINADAGKYDAIGGALADLTRPKRDIYDFLRDYRSLG